MNGEIIVQDPINLDALLNDRPAGLRRYVPPEHMPTGWRATPFKAHVARDPDLAKPITVDRARMVIAMFADDLRDARLAEGAERLVYELERVFMQRKTVFDAFLADVPPFRVAYKNLMAAEAELRAANEAPVSLDPAVAIARENRIVIARNAILVREREKNAAESLNGAQNSKLGDFFTWSKPGGPRELARANVERIVKEALMGNVSDATVEAPAEDIVKMWEPLWAHRAIETYEPTGDALPLEGLRVAFDVRRDGIGAKRAWMRSQLGAIRKQAKP